MLPYARQTRTIGVGCLTLLVLCSCESNTPTTPRSANKSPAALSAADDIPENASVVVGSGDPSVDIPAVQAAVDRGGAVILRGTFSFDATATKPIATQLSSGSGGQPPKAEVLIAKAVSIDGWQEEDGEMATIERGTIPFYVNAPGQSVAIRGLHFVDPEADAIVVYSVQGLEVAASRIEGARPFRAGAQGTAQGIAVVNAGGVPLPTNAGHPENVSGVLRIVGNDIDMTGGASLVDNTLGITVFNVGVPGAEVDVQVAGNRIRNVTEPAINFRRIFGQAEIEHNAIQTGSIIGNAGRNSAIRIANTGSYHVAHNFIEYEWPATDGEGIGVFSQIGLQGWHIQKAMVEDNDIEMRPPAGIAFDEFNAAIGLYGFADSNVVRRNHIRGTARAGITTPSVFPLPPQAAAHPLDNVFAENRFEHFAATVADIFVGNNSIGTLIVGRGTVVDGGTGTVVIRHPGELRQRDEVLFRR
jgi:hypothetical protein